MLGGRWVQSPHWVGWGGPWWGPHASTRGWSRCDKCCYFWDQSSVTNSPWHSFKISSYMLGNNVQISWWGGSWSSSEWKHLWSPEQNLFLVQNLTGRNVICLLYLIPHLINCPATVSNLKQGCSPLVLGRRAPAQMGSDRKRSGERDSCVQRLV